MCVRVRACVCGLQEDPQYGVNVLGVTVRRCSDLPVAGPREPSPYVFYKFYDFPYRDTPVTHDHRHPAFDHTAPYSVAMDADLDRYLKSEELHLYVLDYKEEQTDAYLGKARVPLLTLAHNKVISGEDAVLMYWPSPCSPLSGLSVFYVYLSEFYFGLSLFYVRLSAF